MKIVIASGIYPPDIGGPATYSQIIAREFSKKGIDVSVICYSDHSTRLPARQATLGASDKDENFKIVKILRKNKLFRYWSYFWNLLKLARDCDVIYAQGPLSAGLPAMWVSKILKKRFVLKIVGDYAWEQYHNQETTPTLRLRRRYGAPTASVGGTKPKLDLIEKFQNKKYDWKTELRRKIQKMVCRNADKIIVPSEFLKKIVKGWRISEDKIAVIYNAFIGVENVGRPTSSHYGNFRTSDVIISAGRPEPWKGFEALNEIMPDLQKENPNFKLIIATKMPHHELMEHFKASMVFVLNSAYEGFSHLLLEAMACGLPVITTNVCGNPEIIQDEYNGLLVEYNNKEQIKNAILRLWKDENLRKKFIENGKRTLEKFKLEIMIEKTLNNLKS